MSRSYVWESNSVVVFVNRFAQATFQYRNAQNVRVTQKALRKMRRTLKESFDDKLFTGDNLLQT